VSKEQRTGGVLGAPNAAEFIRRCSFNHSARLKEAVL